MNDAFYRGLADEMTAKLRRISAFTTHGPSIGAYHEEVLRSVLRSMLPSRFALRTGFAFDETHGASQQGDILVVDENYPGAYYFREGEFAIVAPEALICVIEVKTTLSKKTFSEGMDALHSFRRMAPSKAHPVTFLFAYEGSPFTPAVLTSWYATLDIPDLIRNYPWAIFTLSRGLVLLRRVSDSERGHCLVLGENNAETRVKLLAVFLQTVRKVLLLHSKIQTSAFSQTQLDGLTWSNLGFRYKSHVPNAEAA